MPAPRRSRSTSRRIAAGGIVVALLTTCAAIALPAYGSRTPDGIDPARAAARAAIDERIRQDLHDARLARDGRCARPRHVAGVGRACRTRDGMLALPRPNGVLLTHGPDLVDATRLRPRAGGFGTTDSILCSAPGSTRHVVLAYLVPSDHASGRSDVHGDRFHDVAPQLRQALLDAATLVDRTAGELVPGSRRRLRVACSADGQPRVERVVLPRTAARYRNDPDGGFDGIERDLARAGMLVDHPHHELRRTTAVRRVLAYYDADFHQGIAGQGVLWRRSSLLVQGVGLDDPLVSRTVRNVSNNPPRDSLAIQYGTSIDGAPDPPLHTSLLHELAHSMGAVQDEPPTSTRGGHCTDGLDVMCYDDGGPRGHHYRETRCPDPTPASADADDERFDCNGDTYFHPAPPPGNPLAATTAWHLGLPANETLAGGAAGAAQLAAPAAAVATGRGTSITISWQPVPGARGYDLAWRAPGGSWRSVATTATTHVPSLASSTRFEIEVAARDARHAVGERAVLVRRTGPDTTPPTRPGPLVVHQRGRTALGIRFRAATDNDRVVRYRVEQRFGRSWRTIRVLAAPRGTTVVARLERLRPATGMTVRLRAVDARGNASAPGPASSVATRP